MGRIRASHLYSNPRCVISSMLDTSLSAARSLADVYNVISVNDKAKDAQGLVVSSPTGSHIEAIREAPDGIPIFLEKPIAEDANGIREAFEIGENRSESHKSRVYYVYA